ncbi:MAG: site-specific integrase [Pirellulales bacterium]
MAPVEDAVIGATLPHLPKVVQAMIQLQRLTGMRPGEVCTIRPDDVDRTSEVWIYRPAEHKTQHRDRTRVVYIGPRAQEVLRPYLSRPATSYCFSPAEAAQEVRDRRHAQRKTPAGQGNEIGANRKRKPVRAPGERYDVASYRRAIWRACERAFDMPEEWRVIPPDANDASELRERASQWRDANCWNPNQIRHTAATAIRQEAGLEAVQAALGHARIDTSEIYAEKSATLAQDVARRLG